MFAYGWEGKAIKMSIATYYFLLVVVKAPEWWQIMLNGGYTVMLNDCVYYWLFQFRSSFEMKKVKVPTLFLSGLADQLIPSSMMMELYQVYIHMLQGS